MTETTRFLPGLSPVGGKMITATFDGGTLSSNGGLLILREIAKKLGLATVFSRHIPDDRDGRRVRHSYSDMTRARMFAIASGHAAIGRGSRANPASRHRSHSSQLARGRDHGARRQSLRDAGSDGLAGREALRLHLRTVHQLALDRDRAALE